MWITKQVFLNYGRFHRIHILYMTCVYTCEYTYVFTYMYVIYMILRHFSRHCYIWCTNLCRECCSSRYFELLHGEWYSILRAILQSKRAVLMAAIFCRPWPKEAFLNPFCMLLWSFSIWKWVLSVVHIMFTEFKNGEYTCKMVMLCYIGIAIC